MLELIRITGSNKYYQKFGIFKCSCGNTKEIGISNVKSGHTKSCGCLKIIKARMPKMRPNRTLDQSRAALLKAIPNCKITITKLTHRVGTNQHCEFVCHCGNTFQNSLTRIICGHTKSCGCLWRVPTHGKSGDRLYNCFRNMKTRARSRGDLCNVHEDFLDIDKFYEWSLANGYRDDLVLCRNGDTGDYEPGNVRWDTQSNNKLESQGKPFTPIGGLNGK